MKQLNRPANIYLRFLELADAIRGLPSLPPLDPLEDRILTWVVRVSQQGERLSVRDMMAKEEFGWPVTIHKSAQIVVGEGGIMLGDTQDTRRKQIELTQAAFHPFDRLSTCMVNAMEIQQPITTQVDIFHF